MSWEIRVIDRISGKEFSEKIYGEKGLLFLYERENFFSRTLRFLMAKTIFPSRLFAYFQRKKESRKKILPFIRKYQIDEREFVKNVEKFSSFADFFVRQLKPQYRPIDWHEKKAILPADARYLVFEEIHGVDEFYVKGSSFDLRSFLQDDALAQKYERGSLVIARLAPVDYHRFHFPFDCIPSETRKIQGALYSVSPIALKRNLQIFWQNRRFITTLASPVFGSSLFIEVGATCVGNVRQSFTSYKECKKGEEKGVFELGGSTIVMLFEPKKILFDEDLLRNSEKKIETRGLFGQSMGTFRAFDR
jgi:phosphatidylserine decarboxylase